MNAIEIGNAPGRRHWTDSAAAGTLLKRQGGAGLRQSTLVESGGGARNISPLARVP
jgi:hypothetical protein